MKIAIVGDATPSRTRLEKLLHQCGYETLSVRSIEEATTTFSQKRPDAIFSFYHLPDGTVLDLLSEVRAEHAPPIVVVNDVGGSRLASTAIAQGAFDFLSIPFDPQEVEDCARRATSGSKEGKSEAAGRIGIEWRGGILILSFPEEMAYEDANHLSQFLETEQPEPERGLILDLTKTRYLASSGIGALFLLYDRFPSLHDRLIIAGANPQVTHVLRLSGASGFFRFAPSRDEAFRHFC